MSIGLDLATSTLTALTRILRTKRIAIAMIMVQVTVVVTVMVMVIVIVIVLARIRVRVMVIVIVMVRIRVREMVIVMVLVIVTVLCYKHNFRKKQACLSPHHRRTYAKACLGYEVGLSYKLQINAQGAFDQLPSVKNPQKSFQLGPRSSLEKEPPLAS